jgi:hypothetical protein
MFLPGLNPTTANFLISPDISHTRMKYLRFAAIAILASVAVSSSEPYQLNRLQYI